LLNEVQEESEAERTKIPAISSPPSICGSCRFKLGLRTKPRALEITLGSDSKMVLRALQNDRLAVDANRPLPLAIFAGPSDGAPCVMLGMNVFKKSA
jgi:hypothetical protein